MKVVLFSRVPRWYSFKNERLASELNNSGFEVCGVLVETTSTIGSLREWGNKLGWGVFAKKLRARIFGSSENRQKTSDQVPGFTPQVYHFKSHNSLECAAKVKELGADVIVLRGCGILKQQVLDSPKLGVINPHYALLPNFRGMDVTEWSVLCGEKVAVSVHSVNLGVDTGSVLRSELILPQQGDTVGSLRDKSAKLAVKLLKEALIDIREGKEFPENKMNEGGKQYFKMHDRLRSLANQRLNNFA
ncbi:MAG: formyltransferase family protein [Pyrinomonadaceae bacterium]